MDAIGILAYGSLIEDPGLPIMNELVQRITTTTPFPVEFARTSSSRSDAPTLIPFAEGIPVSAQILVLQPHIGIEQATTILYQRETRQIRRTYVRPAKNDINVNTVLVETLRDFEGVQTVLYTKIGSNIETLTADFLAQQAIQSARNKAGANRMDGINYLMAAKRNNIRTLLSEDYERLILEFTGTDDLEAAYQHCRINFVKSNISYFIPALIQLVEGLDFPWNRIDKLFQEKLWKRKVLANGEAIMVDATIFDVMIAAKKGNSTAIGYLDFLNRVFQEIHDNLTPSEHQYIQTNITNLLTKYDKSYLGYVAEIATLNNIIKSKTYRIVGCELRLLNTKPIDFKLRNVNENTEVFVEILSLHLENDKIDNDPEIMKKFLLGRISEKMQNKGMDTEKHTNLYLLTVLWGDKDAIKIYSEFFKENSLGLKNVLEPVSYLTYSDGKGYYEHYFKTISHLFSEHKS